MSAILTTDRLHLRRPEARDAEVVIQFFRSRRARYTFWSQDYSAAWRNYAEILGHWELRGYGLFAVTLRDQDHCLGLVGHWFPEGRPEKEVGWVLWAEAEGKGFGFEAAKASVAYAYEQLGWDTAVSYIAEPNHRSIALAERLGASLDDSAVTLKKDCLVYRHPKPVGAA